ncbi:MAG: thioester reductase domain-containing protein, partial [Actinomycetota bacterium]|nr:thioester reductase domain-containing protein [Actinomycetota bacterium]
DSLVAQRLALALTDRFGVRVSVREVVERQTIRSQAELIRGGDADSRSVRELLERDSVLPSDIAATLPPVSGSPRHVLLTGATGFVGGQLLHDLLRGTGATVHCLVRAENQAAARARIVANLREYALWSDDLADRVVAITGDLGSPRLGLSEEDYRRLAETLDVVVHNGAFVNLVLDYTAHRPSNVEGTVEILRLAATARTKPVHFVSTLGTVPVGDGVVAEDRAPSSAHPEDGYGQSKLVGERLMEAAAERGIPVAVYRIGEVMPHSRHGVPSRHGLPDLLVKAALRMGVAFQSPIALDYTPVDQVGALIVTALIRDERGYFHLLQPKSTRLGDVFAAFRDRFDLPEVPYAEFLQRLADRCAADPDDRDLARVFAVLPSPGQEADLAQLFTDVTGHYGTARTARLFAESGVNWEPVGADVFDRYARACRPLLTSNV